jgi:TPR repeat protein
MWRAFRKTGVFQALLLMGALQVTCVDTDAAFWGDDFESDHPGDILSTNWTAAARAALPAEYLAKKDLSFEEVTNLLCQESRRGNNAAEGLWGVALLATSREPREAKAGLQLVRHAAENGYVPAMLQLGLLYDGNRLVDQDYNEAFRWFSRAANAGDAAAQLQLGGCFHYGLGVARDYSRAAKWYRRSAEQTNYVAMKSLGYLLMNGLGEATNLESAEYWLTRAAKEGGNRRAMNNLGALYSRKFPDTNAMAEALRWYTQSAKLGDPLACSAIANFYYHGWGEIPTNRSSYYYWRLKAASLGATDAQYAMGVACRKGDGVEKDLPRALEWYRKAAAKNHPHALYDLAVTYLSEKTNHASLVLGHDYMLLAAKAGHREAQFQCALSHFEGNLATQDYERGKEWLTKAAEGGWGRAEFYLFHGYYYGIPPAPGCPAYPKDRTEGVRWLRRAAQHEQLQAQSILAVLLIQGTDVEPNATEAEKWLRFAAEHGYAAAQNDLGFAILNGDAGTSDLVEACMWCCLAAAHATDPNLLRRAEGNVANIRRRLTLDQQPELDRRIRDFQVRPLADPDPMPKGWEENPAYRQEDGSFGH